MNYEKKLFIFIILFTIGTIVVIFGVQALFVHIYSSGKPTKNFDISTLISFYSMVFAFVAIFIGIAGFFGWRRIQEKIDESSKKEEDFKKEWIKKEKEIKDKIEELSNWENEFNKYKATVDYLIKKKRLAEWVQSKFEKDAEKNILTSIYFDLTEEEEEKLEVIEEIVLEEITDDSWLKFVYAKTLMEEQKNNRPSGENDFIKKERIFDYIEDRDFLINDLALKQRLYHLKGLMYWFWYENKKSEFIRKHNDEDNILWAEEWWNEAEVKVEEESKSEKKEKQGYKGSELLDMSVKYYKKTLKLFEKNDNVDETLNNLAVVLIELSKFKKDTNSRNDCLDNAYRHLEESINKDFNTYWDQARAEYYKDPQKNNEKSAKYRKLLRKAAENIETKKDKRFFIEKVEAEIKEVGVFYTKGFPGDDVLIADLKEKLDRKYLS
jgi:hypothetical protein